MNFLCFQFSKLTAQKFFCAVALLVAAFAAYAPALSGEFIWDDAYLVGDNPFFKSPIFIFEIFRRYLFLDSFSLYYRPVQNISYMFDYWIWNQNSFGYHVSNVCFHAASGFLLYLVLKRLLRPLLDRDAAEPAQMEARVKVISFLVAMVWVIHPIHNAAVAYISGRADSLASMFALAAWLMWFSVLNGKSVLSKSFCAALGLIFCLTALCSKEIAIVWIILFAIHTCLFEKRISWQNKLLSLGSVLLVVAVYWGLRHLPEHRSAPLGGDAAPLSLRVVLMLRALGDYAGLMFFPYKLHMERIIYLPSAYSSGSAWSENFSYEYLSLLGAATLASFATLCAKKLPGQSIRILGAVWFFIGFAPISNLFPLNAQSAEHWIYMPSIGFLLFLAGCVVALPVRAQLWCAVAVCCAAVGLGARTNRRAQDWAHLETFLTRTIADGGGTPRIHVNLAAALMKNGDYSTSEKILRETLSRFPEYASARIALGLTLAREGKKAEAEQYLGYDKAEADKLAQSFPNTWKAALNFAHLRYESGNSDEALSVLDDAIKRYPGVWDLLRFKTTIVREKSGTNEALKIVKSYTDQGWWDYDAHMMLGNLYLSAGQNEAALSTFQDASRLDIHGVEPLHKMAMIHMALNHPEEAFHYESEAVQRDPNQPLQYVALASILQRLDRTAESGRAMARAEELRKSVVEQAPAL